MPTEARVGQDSRIVIMTGDLTNQPEVDAIVNAANDRLRGGSGVCGAIFKAAGPDKMQAACDMVPADANGIRCPTGEARVTSACDLPNKAVIHAVGPIWNPKPLYPGQNEADLDAAYRSAIHMASTFGFESIAFPAISCGIYGFPMPDGAQVAMRAVSRGLDENPRVRDVFFVFLPMGDGPEIQAHFEKALAELDG